MAQQIPIRPDALAVDPGHDREDGTREIAPDVAYQRHMIVNVIYYGQPGAGDRNWVLIDAGVAGSASRIKSTAEKRFGPGARPSAIVLTHGHFDHVGALETLASEWEVPVFAHALEAPYLNGSAAYPEPDPSVGGGLVATLSRFFPTSPVDVSHSLRLLPDDGNIPPMPGWRWIATPGHTPGHVSLWRERDRTLIIGDAFVTTAQESAYAVALQEPELHGPPMYLTIDWQAARNSVRALAALDPELVVTGHGRAMRGPAMREGLRELATTFDGVAVPRQGRYVEHPATPEDGSAYKVT